MTEVVGRTSVHRAPVDPASIAGGDAPAGPGPSTLTYLPGLDGLRAVAVIAVFLFHGGVAAASGGYLAVSTFFTLSGFLITLLLCGEQGSTGRIALGAFWERRVRRLLPAAALGVALAAVVTAVVGTAAQRQAIGGDGVATFLDVANWRFVLVDRSYGQLFETPSALQHAWSLAIEAQFYWIYPLLFVGVMRLVRGNRARFGVVLAALVLVSLALTRFGGFSADRIYYGTDTRAAEILVGALLGVVVASRRPSLLESRPGRSHRLLDRASALAAAALVATWVLTPAGASWLGSGALGLYAATSAVVILGAAVPGTLLARALGVSPLRWLGRISYGVYLFHWPILILLAPERVPGPAVVRLVVAAAVTIVLAAASARFVERPIRGRTSPFERLGLVGVVVGCAVVALVPSLLVARAAPAPSATASLAPGSLISDTDQLGRPDDRDPSAVRPTAPATTVPASSVPATGSAAPGPLEPQPVVAPSRPLRVVVVGDSVAHELAPLLDGWGEAGGVWKVASHARIGCGIVRGGFAPSELGDIAFGPECSAWTDEWPRMIEVVQPDLVVLAGGFWDAIDRRMADGDPWRAPGDPEHDRLIRDEYDLALDLLTAAGTPVVWLDHPPLRADGPESSVITKAGYDPARLLRLDEIQREVAASHPSVRVVATVRFLEAWPGGMFDEALRPDGVHFSGAGTAPFIDWLGPEVLAAYWSVVEPAP